MPRTGGAVSGATSATSGYPGWVSLPVAEVGGPLSQTLGLRFRHERSANSTRPARCHPPHRWPIRDHLHQPRGARRHRLGIDHTRGGLGDCWGCAKEQEQASVVTMPMTSSLRPFQPFDNSPPGLPRLGSQWERQLLVLARQLVLFTGSQLTTPSSSLL